MLSESFKSQESRYQNQLIKQEIGFIVSFEIDMKENVQFSTVNMQAIN